MPDDTQIPGDDNLTAVTAEESAAPRSRRRAAGRPAGPPSDPPAALPFEAPPPGDAASAAVAETSVDGAADETVADPAAADVPAAPLPDGPQEEQDELGPAATAAGSAPSGAGEQAFPAGEPAAPPAETAVAATETAVAGPADTRGADTEPAAPDTEPAGQEAAVEAPRRSRARRAVRAVLTPVASPTSEPVVVATPVSTEPPVAEPTASVGNEPASQAGPAAGDQEVTGAPARRRARAARRVASAPPEPPAVPQAAHPASTEGEPPASADQSTQVAETSATVEATASSPAGAATLSGAATSTAPETSVAAPETSVAAPEAPAAPARTRRRSPGRRGRAVENVTADEAAEAAPATPAASPVPAPTTAEAPAIAEAPSTEEQPPTEPLGLSADDGARASAPRWSAGSTFSAGFDAQVSTPRVVRRPVTTVTFQAPDLAAHEPPAARGRDRDRDWDRERDRERDLEKRPARSGRETPAPETEQATQVDDEVVVATLVDIAEAEEAPEPGVVGAETGLGAEAGLEDAGTRRRRRGRRGRGRTRGDEDGYDTAADEADEAGAEQLAAEGEDEDEAEDETVAEAAEDEDEDDGDRAGSRRRRRRRRRTAAAGEEVSSPDDPPNTVVHVRETRRDDDLVRGVTGSTRLEAKRQRRREGRDVGRRRPPIVTEAEFLARRESVERRMLVRHAGDRTQIAVLEDGVLVEHFVTRASSASYAGNVYLGRVQNVLASMEAAFVDIGKGRNAVLYAGEVNYDASGLEGKPRKIEQALKPGQSVLVQVSKDPIGHKGARLTSQISLPGRYLVYVPDGQSAGISRKLPDTERSRLKSILKKITPEDGGVIVRTAAEGASEQELERDIERLAAQWEDIARKAQKANAPALLYGEPDLVVRVIRDIFNEDFTELLVQGSGEAETIESYVDSVAPDLRSRVRRHVGTTDLFTEYRVDEQLAKALDRKVWLPSGGSLVIDRTEAMTVVDVNTGKFTGKGGNLEETVTKNNLEAAEEIVRQLRLRDIGGIIVIDFIDMVLESNRELVLRRLTECLGRDRTRHQVAEVTSLGLVQMTRKRVGQGLLEAYSESCAHCNGRGVLIHLDGHHAPAAAAPVPAPPPRRAGRRGLVPAPLLAGSASEELEGLDENDQTAVPEPEATGPAEGSPETADSAGAARETGRRSRRARRAASPVIAADVVPVAAAADSAAPSAETVPARQPGSPVEKPEPVTAAPLAAIDGGTGWPDDTFGTAESQPVQARPGEPAGVGWPVNGSTAHAQGHQNGVAHADVTSDALAEAGTDPSGPTVFANSSDPDSIAVESGGAGGRGRRPRRASRPVAKPTESIEAEATSH